MEFTPVFEKINYDVVKGKIKEQIKAECKTEVSVDSVASVLSVYCTAFVDDTGVKDGKAGYGGRVLFYVSYIDKDGEVRKAECGNEFSGTIKDELLKNGDRTVMTITSDKTETSLSGAFLSVTAYLTVSAIISSPAEVPALSGGENLVVDVGEIEQLKGLGERSSSYPIEEEFEISYPVAEVLSYGVSAVVTAAQCGVGTIIVDGEVLLSLIMLQKNDKRDIIRENKTLPFRAEIDFEEAMPQMQAVARVKERSVKLDVAVDATTGKSTVTASLNLKLQGQAFSIQSLTVAKDVFSVDKELEIEKSDVCCYKQCEQRILTATVKGRATIDELPIGAGVFAVCNERVEITEHGCSESAVTFTGVLSATTFLRDGDFKPFVKKVELPFECSFDCVLGCGVEIDTVAKASLAKAKIISATEIEIESVVNFAVYPAEKCSFKVVKGVKATGEKQTPKSAISVYIPTEGEDLWSLSKRLNVCPESLLESNRELCFPLTGNERIVVYRQK